MPYKKSDKTELKKDEKRKLIFKTAAKVFAEKGYHQTSVKDITDRAEVSVGTFYLYFRNKEDLFEKLYDEMEQIINNIKNYAMQKKVNNAAERFANVIAASVWTYETFRELSKIMLIEAVGLNPRFEKKYADIMVKSCAGMEATLKDLKDKGIIDVPDTKVAAIGCEGAFNHAIIYWLRTEEKADLKLYTYPMVVFSLQALKINFSQGIIKASIDEIFQDLDKRKNEFI
ncbi:TetR/AcrR family transcriptional regulator [Clostridium sp. 19966]|uniref:TetR/AcrR family transcriptional regulator n=1 Tax=Clostridium sp. 19966 TaxID=2768166 RepID=UPI0028DE7961|nr:TetR/AcrR family transcriptional regulator [Clostridium sp. 19966]MDT8717516.1 TetR/AcrR family transcriptional regulator [Clostridium sp. 19966]